MQKVITKNRFRFAAFAGALALAPRSQAGLLINTAKNWAHQPDGAPILLNGVNRNLNGTPDGVGGCVGGSTATDFFVIGVMEHDASGAGHHDVVPAPEPLTTGLAFSALMIDSVVMARRRRAADVTTPVPPS